MTIFNGIPPEGRSRSKFVRVEGIISLTAQNDTDTYHAELVAQDGLIEHMADTLNSNPIEVDGGFIVSDSGRKLLMINGVSTGLDIPKNEDARSKTGEIMQALLPNYEIRTLPAFTSKQKER